MDVVDGRATVDSVDVGVSQYRIVRLVDESLLFNDVVQVVEVNSLDPMEIVLPFSIAADAPTVELTKIAATSTNEVSSTITDETTATAEMTPSTTVTAEVIPSKMSTATVSAITPTTAVTPTLPVIPTITATGTNSTTPTVTATATATKPATPTPTPGPGSGSVKGTNGAGLNCRATPSTSGTVITVIAEGTVVPYRGPAQNGWQPVTCAGKAGFDTPTGTFYINAKVLSQTMSGVLGREYYNVPNVPYVMYFTDRGHAIHGAHSHSKFGM